MVVTEKEGEDFNMNFIMLQFHIEKWTGSLLDIKLN